MFAKIKPHIEPFFIALLFIGFFFSHAVLSIGSVAFCGWIFFRNYKQYSFANLQNNFAYFSLGGLFIITLLTGIYSVNTAEWINRTIVKLPMLLIPLAFLTLRISKLHVFTLHQLFIFIVLGGSIYSAGSYYLYSDQFLAEYKYAKVIPTLVSGDHIRFSWAVQIAILMCLITHAELKPMRHKIFNASIGLWLLVYLHILGSKTGLLITYGAILLYVLFFAKKIKIGFRIAVICTLILLPIIAYFTLASFKERIHYIKYDFEQYSTGKYYSGLSDGARVLSIKAGSSLTKTNMILGVGFGDIEQGAIDWYNIKAPQLQTYEHILPSSQYLLYSAGAGLLGLFILGFCLWQPFRVANKFAPFYLFYIPALVSLIWEIHAEGQNGVFIFTFFTSWFLYLARNKQNDYAA